MLITKRAVIDLDLISKDIATEAIYDEAGLYRYYLCWRWSDAPALYFWLLNPSTADHNKTDPTLSGLIARARAWGYGAVVLINLLAFRATSPEAMRAASNPVGDENDAVVFGTIRQAFNEGSPVICGWGNHGVFLARNDWAVEIAGQAGVALSALAINESSGQPKHPLYIAHEARPFMWKGV